MKTLLKYLYPLSRIIEAAVVAGTINPIFAIDHNWVKSFS